MRSPTPGRGGCVDEARHCVGGHAGDVVVFGCPGGHGQVERGPEHANSICSFSGLNDDPTDPEDPGRVQSYGQIVRQGGKAFAPSPGTLCNGHLFPYPEACEEETP